MQKSEQKPDFIKMEHDILHFWEENDCFNKLVHKNKNNMPFRFLDGPITANNPMGIHHAWGRSIKDIFLRYKAMNGLSCLYRNGFDTQGLWVEVEVEKELGFKDKKDIENYGTDKFTGKCLERIHRFSNIITEQSKRLGQWMDWSNSYFTHTDENITAIWHFLKVCHHNNWIIKSHKPMPWCPRCGTSLSDHEMSGSYKEIEHTAVFARLPLIEESFDILVWTTTPWTLSANTALAVNPGIEYALVDCGNNQRPVITAANTKKALFGKNNVLRLFKGSELIGLHYETFFPFLSIQKDVEHKIIPWNDVSADEGCGIVHIAPGCGAEDFDLGKTFNLPEICPVNEAGLFYDNYDFLSGLEASKASDIVFDKLTEQGKLYKTHKYKHSYPVCWRCKTDVLFRLVDEWYIKTDEIKPRLLEAARKVQWEPEYIGKRMNDWLENMGDWNISRKRYYGLPLPFYPCKNCGRLTVVGSKDELKELGGTEVDNVPELHRPWIDTVEITCPECRSKVARVTEVGDVWLDAGITPFSTLGYFTDRADWEKNFPSEWVTEMREQVRLWFYSLLFMSVTLTGKAPYERVLAYNSVVAEDGTKFSKTGFMIKFDDAAEKIGADTIRYLFAGANTSSDVRFGFSLGDEARRKLLSFYNIYTFFMTYAAIDNPDLSSKTQVTDENITDRWLDNRIKSFLKAAETAYNNFDTAELVKQFELCIDDVSNWYIRINRRRFWKQELDSNKSAAYLSLFNAIKLIIQVMSPVIPFLTEYMWQNMVRRYNKAAEVSVHLSSYPAFQGEIEGEILSDTSVIRDLISAGLKLRNEKQIKIKQPLSVMYIKGSKLENAVTAIFDIIKDELNVKSIVFLDSFDQLYNKRLSLNFKTAGRALKEDLQIVKGALSSLMQEDMNICVEAFEKNLPVDIPGYIKKLSYELFAVETTFRQNFVITESDEFSVALDTSLDDKLVYEGLYRELLRHCQVLRKEAGFNVEERIKLAISSKNEEVDNILKQYNNELMIETLAVSIDNILANPRFEKEIIMADFYVRLQICGEKES
ncbi:MAG: ileS [Eubacterium sp.]|jgi:isoleucyl-tRNA synthetase|nr:ileS [Eubacterium sp.]